MKVLMITGDKNLFRVGTEAHGRLQAQRRYADITPVFWGRGSLLAPLTQEGLFDVVTAQDPFWRGVVGWYVARTRGARFNVQLHADLEGQSPFRRALARAVLKRADSVRVVTEALKAQVVRVGVRAPISVLPVFISVPNVVRSAPQGMRILWAGRFEAEKDPLLAIDILKEVRAAGIDATLTMLGDGTLMSQLKERARGLPVTFPGWQHKEGYYTQLANADVLLNTSPHESFGAAMVEALAIGVPVVAPDVGVAREAGALVAPRANLTATVVEALRSKAKGVLKIELLGEEEWAEAWVKTL